MRGYTKAAALLLAVLLCSPRGGHSDDGISKLRGRVCDSVDARNTADSLLVALQDCRVVEGYVHIQLIDLGNDTELEKLSFPELREISHHLMLYRVGGLRSLSQLFPNLAVIRGASLYYDEYALVVYEMFGLQDVALPSLVVIARGGVLLEKNPSLCYVNTVDWSKLVKDQNLGENGVRLREGRMMPCPSTCPARCGAGGCWNEQHCQHSDCPLQCGDAPCFVPHSNKIHEIMDSSAVEPLECCHNQCLGGCWGPGPHQCYLCLNVIYNQTCIAQCPSELYTFHSSRCITKDQCHTVGIPHIDIHDFEEEYKPWRVFNGSCIPNCPPGYEEHQINNEDGVTLTCKTCGKGGCRKVCMSNKIDSITKAYNLKGCTHINTSLEIQIIGGKDISQELEESLGSIEEIDGYLKITRSFTLLNLNFLRNLRVIHGNPLELGKYSLAVMDNQNLQELWNWSARSSSKLQLGNGTIFFHLNPKLCLREIHKLEAAAGLKQSSITEQDVSSLTNGDEVECIVVDLQAKVTKKLVSGVLLEWEVLSIPKHDTLLGYLVYSIEAPEQNVTAYDGLDACGGNDWRVDDVSNTANFDDDSSHTSDHGHTQTQILTRLKPNTQYAFYVKTYSLTTLSRYGGQSPIQYFTTLPSRPSPPINLRASSNHHSELLVQWGTPVHPNGNLSYYLVLGQWIPDDQEFLLEQRDYCLNPMTPEEGEESAHILNTQSAPKRSCCNHHRPTPVSQASTQHIPSSHTEDCIAKCGLQLGMKVEISIEDCFTSFLHELPYQQELNYTENLAAQDTFPQDDAIDEKKKNDSRDPSVRQNITVGGVFTQFSYVVPANLGSVLAKPLRHFGLYSIQVWACRHPHPQEPPTAERCSSASQISLRTAPHRSSDTVTSVNATVLDQSGVRLHWSPPANPNGLVLAFHVEWRREGQGSFRPLVECLSVPNFKAAEGSYVLGNLASGSYSMRIRTTSLAGDGPYSERTNFIIPSLIESNRFERNVLLTILIIAGLIFLIAISLIIWWKQRHHKMEAEDMCLIASVNPDYVSANYTEDEWELVRNRVTLIRELGQGSFGMVYEGELCPEGSGPPVPCAIKTMNESANCRERLQFLHEASVMKAFTAHHVVRLLGVVSRGQPTLVVMELMARGDLKTYLRSSRDTGEPSAKRLLHIAAQIADGMLYLSTKKFVHRDLAARNCMVSQDLTVKIGDFGMTRDIYETDYYRKGSKGLLPVRWMAPESLQDGVFTSSSDVWSYGVVLWEMSTHAEQPYQGFSNEQVLQKILSGESLSAPNDCPAVLAHMMESCWQQVPIQRPGFATLLEQLLPLVSSEFEQYSFYHSRSNNSAEASSRSHNSIPHPPRQNGNIQHVPP